MIQEYDADKTHKNKEHDNFIPQGANCLIDEIGPVIGSYDFYTLGETRLDVFLDP